MFSLSIKAKIIKIVSERAKRDSELQIYQTIYLLCLSILKRIKSFIEKHHSPVLVFLRKSQVKITNEVVSFNNFLLRLFSVLSKFY